ncbi:MAG TPA: prephenate dehydrogenase [Methylomusa anaerophila]|uniref:Prephenate dehydrogenase n=1 Tax=Methylomusa anaerophila TaxID=1930071 RepID=A0A348ANM8_9FIRM|nr:prephenate dehydrogenase [Methylomusa anaerophila]BBB92676.1 prephenate dehydrogenase [Methylomusa anaerophila]HML87471.1 prephenate dehydrogenase [Methylomusa anaerophila]
MNTDKTRITIIGMGLIGGSLGLAIKKALGDQVRLTGVDREEETLRLALEQGAADHVTSDAGSGAIQADIIFLCIPVLQMVPVIKQIVPALKPGAILTDVGSTKCQITETILSIIPPEVHYVPGHPMAGKEKNGITAADQDLFLGKWFIITPYPSVSPQAAQTLADLIKQIGAKVTVMDMETHDWCTAIISHVPHVAAAAMVNLLEYSPDFESSLKLAGGGFKDTTRIASSSPDMWADICMTNGEAINDNLEKLQRILGEVIAAIRTGNRPYIHNFFQIAKRRRDELLVCEQEII